MCKQKGFSLIELLIVVAIILIIAAIAIPSLLRSRIAANDSAAAASLRTIDSAELTYLSTYPINGYSQSLRRLGPNGINCVTGTVDFRHACLIDGDLGCPSGSGPCLKDGFEYFMGGTAPGAGQPATDYVVSAGPSKIGTSGDRDYCSVPDAVIRQTLTGTAPAVLAAPGVTIATCGNAASYEPIQ